MSDDAHGDGRLLDPLNSNEALDRMLEQLQQPEVDATQALDVKQSIFAPGVLSFGWPSFLPRLLLGPSPHP